MAIDADVVPETSYGFVQHPATHAGAFAHVLKQTWLQFAAPPVPVVGKTLFTSRHVALLALAQRTLWLCVLTS